MAASLSERSMPFDRTLIQLMVKTGRNTYGHLGLGDTNNRGDSGGEMGDNLAEVDLGTGFEAVSIGLGWLYSCFVSQSAEIKCFGRNNFGQLGYGDTQNRGDAAGEMGDDLLVVDLGNQFNVSLLSRGVNAIHICAGDHSSYRRWKCWGYVSCACTVSF